MADGILIEIVSPERLLLSEQAQSVTVPGSEGYFTVMGDHAPLMTTLKPGFITVNGANGAQTFYVRGGFADVSPDGLTILAEQASTAADFDRAAIERLLAEAREALAAAEGFDDKNFAQEMVDGWTNLMAEAEHMRVSHSHAA
jgi:F-type H+-transporting ATPase subunit epsilon